MTSTVIGYILLGVAALLIRQSLAAGTAGLSRLRAIREGVTYVRRTPVVASTMVMDFTAMLFGFPVALFPALALSVFGVGAPGLGLLVSAIAIGALIASVLSGPLTAMRHKGVGVTVLFATWGTAIALFGLATFSFPLALLFLAIAGAADIAAAVLRASIVQSTIPDNMRGRVTSINSLIATAGPRLGDLVELLVEERELVHQHLRGRTAARPTAARRREDREDRYEDREGLGHGFHPFRYRRI